MLLQQDALVMHCPGLQNNSVQDVLELHQALDKEEEHLAGPFCNYHGSEQVRKIGSTGITQPPDTYARHPCLTNTSPERSYHGAIR
jgi:hypothetical protein